VPDGHVLADALAVDVALDDDVAVAELNADVVADALAVAVLDAVRVAIELDVADALAVDVALDEETLDAVDEAVAVAEPVELAVADAIGHGDGDRDADTLAQRDPPPDALAKLGDPDSEDTLLDVARCVPSME